MLCNILLTKIQTQYHFPCDPINSFIIWAIGYVCHWLILVPSLLPMPAICKHQTGPGPRGIKIKTFNEKQTNNNRRGTAVSESPSVMIIFCWFILLFVRLTCVLDGWTAGPTKSSLIFTSLFPPFGHIFIHVPSPPPFFPMIL